MTWNLKVINYCIIRFGLFVVEHYNTFNSAATIYWCTLYIVQHLNLSITVKDIPVQARSQVFSLGGAFGERSEPTRSKQLRSERSEQAVAGVWGRSPQRGPGAEPLGGG